MGGISSALIALLPRKQVILSSTCFNGLLTVFLRPVSQRVTQFTRATLGRLQRQIVIPKRAKVVVKVFTITPKAKTDHRRRGISGSYAGDSSISGAVKIHQSKVVLEFPA